MNFLWAIFFLPHLHVCGLVLEFGIEGCHHSSQGQLPHFSTGSRAASRTAAILSSSEVDCGFPYHGRRWAVAIHTPGADGTFLHFLDNVLVVWIVFVLTSLLLLAHSLDSARDGRKGRRIRVPRWKSTTLWPREVSWNTLPIAIKLPLQRVRSNGSVKGLRVVGISRTRPEAWKRMKVGVRRTTSSAGVAVDPWTLPALRVQLKLNS